MAQLTIDKITEIYCIADDMKNRLMTVRDKILFEK
jgi:hypothetical protein